MRNVELSVPKNKITNEKVDSIKIYISRSGALLQYAQMEDGRIGVFATKNGDSKLLITTTPESFKETYLKLTSN